MKLQVIAAANGPTWRSRVKDAALTPLSVDGMIVAASTTLLADSRVGDRAECCPGRCRWWEVRRAWPPNVAVAKTTPAGRVIAAWPSFALIGAYELLIREGRRSAGR